MTRQPDDRTCGATCLHALYRHYDDDVSLEHLGKEIPQLPNGGTMGVHLANHALARGYDVDVYTYNLQLFDPSWFDGKTDIPDRLRKQRRFKHGMRLQEATTAYLEFFERGGRVHFVELTPRLIVQHLDRKLPILAGLSSTYLYGTVREHPETEENDDLRGEPVGHFVVLCGIDPADGQVLIADPYSPNPVASGHFYHVSVERALGAILLGIITYDANLVVIHPKSVESPEHA